MIIVPSKPGTDDVSGRSDAFVGPVLPEMSIEELFDELQDEDLLKFTKSHHDGILKTKTWLE